MHRAFLFSLPLLGGCVVHSARIEAPASTADGIAIGTQVHPGVGLPIEQHSGLPIELPVTAWRRDSEGNGEIERWDGVLRTPTPWWQRFPSDVVFDVVFPDDHVAAASVTPTWRRISGGDASGLAERARAAGYAGGAPPAPEGSTR